MGILNLFDLTGQVALVTGAGSGLGKAFAEALAEAGAKVVCVDINPETAAESARAIHEACGVETLSITTDVTNEAEVAAMMKEVEEKFNRLDILVNNAGLSGNPALIHEMSFAEWNKVVAVNLNGVFLCTREAARLMVAQKKGKIINIASVWGVIGTSGVAPLPQYAATKGAVVNFTREAALEYAPMGIKVNCIAPGFFGGTNITEGWDDAFINSFMEEAPNIIPTRQFGEPGDLKGTIIYLASSASDAVTGHILLVDNGITAW